MGQNGMHGGNVKIIAIIEIHEVFLVSIYFVSEEHIVLPPVHILSFYSSGFATKHSL
jgi:hypothetical protein